MNHPGIAGIYGIEKSDSGRFLVLELVEGETLAKPEWQRRQRDVRQGTDLDLRRLRPIDAARSGPPTLPQSFRLQLLNDPGIHPVDVAQTVPGVVEDSDLFLISKCGFRMVPVECSVAGKEEVFAVR